MKDIHNYIWAFKKMLNGDKVFATAIKGHFYIRNNKMYQVDNNNNENEIRDGLFEYEFGIYIPKIENCIECDNCFKNQQNDYYCFDRYGTKKVIDLRIRFEGDEIPPPVSCPFNNKR